jgi:hypothetical protein
MEKAREAERRTEHHTYRTMRRVFYEVVSEFENHDDQCKEDKKYITFLEQV